MRHEVTRYEVPETDGFSVERMSGTEANTAIRGKVVDSMADELWTYEMPDRQGNALRVVARTAQDYVHSGPREVREVYEQAVTGTAVREGDWLEGEAPQPPRPSRQPVKVGDRVTAMPDGYSLGAGLVTSVEWKQHGMQPPYDKPPLWTWEWRVTVWFGGEETRENRWHSDWIEKANDYDGRFKEGFEQVWQKLEAELPERQAAE